MKKCEHGYIKKQKIRKLFVVLLYLILGVAIFLTGYYLNDRSKSNVFTVVAILLVLPAAKHLVAFIVLAPFRTQSEEVHEKIMSIVEENGVVLTDYVFTSSEKIMGLSYLVLSEGNAIGFVSNQKQDLKYITKYLSTGIHKLSPDYHVKIFKSKEEFIKFYSKKNAVSVTDNQKAAVEEWLRSLAV